MQSTISFSDPATAARRWRPAGALFALLLAALLAGPVPAQTYDPAPLDQPNLDLRVDGRILAVVRQPDGGVVFGGSFTLVDGQPAQHLARLRANGTLDTDWQPAPNNQINALEVDDAGNLYVGGWFDQIGGVARASLARLSPDGTLDANWNPDVHRIIASGGGSFRAVGPVNALALNGDGALYVAGDFNRIGAAERETLGKLSTGSSAEVDSDWNPALVPNQPHFQGRFPVTQLVPLGDALFVAGPFNQIGGLPRAGLAKLSATGTGTVDADWNPQPTDQVSALAADENSALLVGGLFDQIGGVARNGLARLSPDGSGTADATWNPLSSNSGAWTDALVIDAGSVYVTVAGSPAWGGLRKFSLTGIGDSDPTWSALAAYRSELPMTVAGGKLFTRGTGRLMQFDGISGALAQTTRAEHPGGQIWAVARQPNGGLILAGDFHLAGTTSTRNLLRLRPDHSVDPDWNPGQLNGPFGFGPPEFSPTNRPLRLAVDGNGDVFIAGGFGSIGSVARSGLAKISGNTGVIDAVWNPQPEAPFGQPGVVHALNVDAAGDVYVAGDFSKIGGLPRASIAKLSGSSGVPVSGWDAHLPTRYDFLLIQALALDTDGALYAGGVFASSGATGPVFEAIIKLATADGTQALDWQVLTNASGAVHALSLDGMGNLYAGGRFANLGGVVRKSLAKLTIGGGTGQVDPIWDPSAEDFGFLPDSPPGTVFGLLADINGSVFVSGYFTHVGGAERGAFLDGTSFAGFAKLLSTDVGVADSAWHPHPNNLVLGMELDDSDTLLIGGSFNRVGGQVRTALAALPTSSTSGGSPIFQDGFESGDLD